MSLEAINLTAGYAKRKVLDKVNLTVPQGKVSVLVGPNGCGKSTLLRCLARAQRYETGAVCLDSADIATIRAGDYARKVAYVPQENPMLFAFTVAETVGLGAASPEALQKALGALEMNDLKAQSVISLSGGERQRAALSRGLAQETPYLLLDEPTAHLDLRYQKLLLDAVRERAVRNNTGILLVLHDLNQAAAYADTLFLMQKGGIIASGEPQEVLTEETIQQCYQTKVQISREKGTDRISIRIL